MSLIYIILILKETYQSDRERQGMHFFSLFFHSQREIRCWGNSTWLKKHEFPVIAARGEGIMMARSWLSWRTHPESPRLSWFHTGKCLILNALGCFFILGSLLSTTLKFPGHHSLSLPPQTPRIWAVWSFGRPALTPCKHSVGSILLGTHE